MDDDFVGVERITRGDALAVARAQARRDLVISETSIRYVAFVPGFEDHCLCEFVLEGAGWIQVFRPLAPAERLPGEVIPDERIVQLARSGNLLSAIRLFRTKHEAGLLEGQRGVESLLRRAGPPATMDGG